MPKELLSLINPDCDEFDKSVQTLIALIELNKEPMSAEDIRYILLSRCPDVEEQRLEQAIEHILNQVQ